MQTTLSHYRICEQIGAGAMGVVYRAHDERLDRDVALKIICPGVLSSVARRRFHTEALVLSKINHPNIATVYDFDSQDGTDFLVTELIPGLSLEEMLVAGALPEKEIIALGSQLADGLTAAHSQQVIHRDLKPSNIRVTPDARLKILDFGLARIVHRERPVDATASTLEMQGVSGTLPYMAPEQLLNHKLDARVDIWGLGCILYEMATGRRPFLGSGPALVDAVLHHEPPHVGKLNPNISTALNNVIFRCLEKDPQKRYRSAHEIATDLRRVSSRSWLLRVFKRPARLQAAKAAVVGLALAVAMAFYWWPYPRFAHGPSRRISSPAPNPQPLAHDFYLQGLGYLERFDKPGNLDSAIALFQQAVKADPGFALAFSALGEAYWGKYRLDQNPRWVEEAERSSRRAAELNDQLPAVYVTLARIHNGRGLHNLALQEIQRALKIEPRDADAVLGLAAVYESMGREHEAEGLYAKGASFRPTYWGGFYELMNLQHS